MRPIDTLPEFPAPAGINRNTDTSPFRAEGVPRASGDKPEFNVFLEIEEMSSPRQRG